MYYVLFAIFINNSLSISIQLYFYFSLVLVISTYYISVSFPSNISNFHQSLLKFTPNLYNKLN